MKKVLFGFGLILVVSFAGKSSTGEIDRMITGIKKPRQSLDIAEVKKVKDPFIVAQMDTGTSEIIVAELKKPVPKFTLSATVNNKAYINGDWYEKDESILGYTLAYVGRRGVVLTFEKNILKIFLPDRTRRIDGVIMIKEGM